MLPEWYFCCCIDASAENTNIFLEITDLIRNEQSEDRTLSFALEELRKTEIWMKLYLFQDVLGLLHRRVSGEVRASARAYFDDILEFLPSETGESFRSLIDVLYANKDPRAKLKECAELLVQRESGTHPNSEAGGGGFKTLTPYVDLKEFMEETLWLGLVADIIQNDEDRSSLVATELKQSAEMGMVLENALSHRYGRSAFRAAMFIADRSLIKNKEELSVFWNLPDCAPDLEPDLMESYARWFFLENEGASDEKRARMVNRIVAESLTLVELGNLSSHRRAQRKWSAVLSRFDYSTTDIGRGLSIIFWQATLWQLAAQCVPELAAESLANYWLIPGDPTFKTEIKAPLYEDEIYQWQEDLDVLTQLRQLRQIEKIVIPRREIYVPRRHRWIFFSPWLTVNRHRKDQDPHYETTIDIVSQVRLLAATSVAITLLRRLKAESSAAPILAMLVVHAASVLAMYRDWLRGSYKNPQKFNSQKKKDENEKPKLGPRITGLAVFMRNGIESAGKGSTRGINPALFLDLLDKEKYPRQLTDGTRSSDRYEFFSAILPEVLMSWISSAYTGASDESGMSQWLPRIGDVYSYYQKREHARQSRIEASNVVRFLCPETQLDRREFDWRRRKDWPKWHPRLFFAGPRLTSEEWAGVNDGGAWGDVKLAIAIERISALGEVTEGDPRFSWRDKFKAAINRINETKHLDRFARLRLLEVFDEPALENWYEGQELVALLLLEFGAYYELRKLFDAVFSPTKDCNVVRKDIQLLLVKGIYRYLEIRACATESRVNPISPRYRQYEREKLNLLETTLMKLAFINRSDAIRRQPATMGKLISELEVERWNRRVKTASQTIHGRIEQHANRKQIVLENDQQVAPWLLDAMSYDPSTTNVTLSVRDLHTSGVIDLFSLPQTEYDEFLNSDSAVASVSAVAVQVKPAATEGGESTYTFNCGLPYYLTHSKPGPPDLTVGTHVKLPVVKVDTNQNGKRWTIPKLNAWDELKPDFSTGDVVRVQVTENKLLNRCELQLLATEHDDESFPIELWDPDYSRSFRPRCGLATPAFGRRNSPQKLEPIDLSLVNLILDENVYGAADAIVLTLVGDARATNRHGDGWRFSSRPGRNYRIGRSDFEMPDGLEIERAIRAYANPAGLIITVQPVMDDGTLRLRLVKEMPDDPKLGEAYPKLSVPFDERNLVWRDAFPAGETFVATHQPDNSWKVPVEPAVKGFPREVTVGLWVDSAPPPGLKKVELAITKWNQRAAIIEGTLVATKPLSIEAGMEEQFLSRYLNVDPGQQFDLVKAVGRLTDGGKLLCFTSDRMPVSVYAESLTLGQIATVLTRDNRLIEKQRPRRAEVTQDRGYVGRPFNGWRKWRVKGAPVTATIDESELGYLNGTQVDGILVKVPVNPGNTLFEVLWRVGNKAVRGPLTMEVHTEKPIQPGTRIQGTWRNGRWTWSLLILSISCRALWSLTEKDAPDPGALYLDGQVYVEGDYVAMAEARPGELVIIEPSPSASHLATWNGSEFKGGLEAEERVLPRPVIENEHWFDGDTRFNRVVLMRWSGRAIVGASAEDNLHHREVAITEVDVALTPVAGGYYAIERVFRVSRIRQRDQVAVRQEPGNAYWESKLRKYLELGPTHRERRVAAKVSGDKVILADYKVPLNAQWSHWTDTLTVPENHLANMTPPPVSYGRDARVVLLTAEDGSFFGSFAKVPPMGPVAFMYDVGGQLGRFRKLNDSLYYIGPLKFHPVTGEDYGEDQHHLFEWGFGKMLSVPESCLTINGKSFRSAELFLAIGDSITGLTFRKLSPRAPQASEPGNCMIELNSFDLNTNEQLIHPSHGSRLYAQRNKYRMIHLLYILATPSKGTVTIEYVEAINSRGTEISTKLHESKATLDDDSQERVLRSCRQSNAEEPIWLTVFGRLNEDVFKESRGREVVFQHVRLTFIDSELGPALKPNDQVLLIASKIARRTNETILKLTWKGLGGKVPIQESEIGNDFYRDLALLRREFSARENLLRRMIDVYKNEDQLAGDQLLVQVSQKKDGGVFCSRTANPPIRTPTVLRTMVRQQRPFLAVVSRPKSDSSDHVVAEPRPDRLRIEADKNVFVELRRDQIGTEPSQFQHGEIVQIDNAPLGKFVVTRAAYGDVRYLGDRFRPAVLLPKNYLLDQQRNPDRFYTDKYWMERDAFTVGGLPNLEPIAGKLDHAGAWNAPDPRDCVRLLRLKHPEKIATVGRDDVGKVRFHADARAWPVGRLRSSGDDLHVYYTPLGGSAKGDQIAWRFQSFGDQSVAEIQSRITEEKWKYHDRMTGLLTRENGAWSIKTHDIDKHDGWTGPLFFERGNAGPRLRYSREAFMQFGFPVEELVLSLHSKKQRIGTYPVAGVPAEGGLWIELAPGRIVEVPPRLLMIKTRREEISLEDFHWDAFAPGDLVELQVTASSPLQVDRILLKDWIPRARGAFGPQRCLLPVTGYDEAAGRLTLGDGEFKLSLPLAEPNTRLKVVALHPDNELDDANGTVPETGDVVLLQLNDENQPQVAGFTGLTPRPALKNPHHWKGDTLSSAFLIKDGQRISYDSGGLRDLIAAVGGALPVTVEEIVKSGEERHLLFTRRHQRSGLSSLGTHLTMGRVIGLQADGKTALLRCGGDIVRLKMDRIVDGLPSDHVFISRAVEYLKQSREPVYLRGTEHGTLQAGLNSHTDSEYFVRPLQVLSVDQDGIEEAGLICRHEHSLTLGWLPATNAAWTALTPDLLHGFFVDPNALYVKVQRRPNGTVSLVHTAAAEKEFRSYVVGRELVVRILKKLDDLLPTRYLVESLSSRIILECRLLVDEELKIDDTRTMEVASVNFAPQRLTVVPQDMREWKLDLPSWLLEKFFSGQRRRRNEFDNYLRWRDEVSPVVVGENLEVSSTAELNRWLCFAFRNANTATGDHIVAAGLALEWKRRFQYETEIDLAYGLIAALLLEHSGNAEQNSEWRSHARDLVQNLGERALHSAQVEVIYRWIFEGAPKLERESGIVKRLNSLLSGLNKEMFPKPSPAGANDAASGASRNEERGLSGVSIQSINQLRRAVELRSVGRFTNEQRELELVSAALAASTGSYASDLVNSGKAGVTKRLIDIYRTIPKTQASVTTLFLNDSHVEELRQILDDLNEAPLDLTLLGNLIRAEMSDRETARVFKEREVITL